MVVVVDLDLDRVKEGLLGVSMQVDHVVLVVVGLLLMRLTPGKMDNTLQIEGYY